MKLPRGPVTPIMAAVAVWIIAALLVWLVLR